MWRSLWLLGILLLWADFANAGLKKGTLLKQETFAEVKVALVIGNSEYEGNNKLPNPVNDARDMAKVLAGYGFEVVGYNKNSGRLDTLDLDYPKMETYISQFRSLLKKDGVALFYYAGHGMQKDGVNYLIPLNHNVNSPEQLKYKTVNAKMVLEEMEAAQSFLNVVILDACRDSPFRSFRGSQTGLSSMNAPAGSIVIFSTHEGGTAFDGVVNGRNGLFTSHLLAAMQNGNQEIESIFKATSKKVQVDAKSYDVKQIPFLSSSFNEQFCFGICGNGQAVVPQPAAPAYVPSVSKPAPVASRQSFEPEMIPIPAGTFEMGSTDGESDEKPVKSWKLNTFYMSKYETTIGQYLVCVQDGGCNQPEWLESGSEYNIRTGSKNDYYAKRGMSESNKNNPITGVSWKDAVAYGEWLSKKTGKTYRLPTEAEWEYAARAGSTTKYWWGDNLGSNKANCDGCGSQWDNKQTAPVGSFSANVFGLYDMAGNVWEWTCSEYGAYSEGKQTQCNQSVTGRRVLRGGSWGDKANSVRSANRNNSDSTNRDSDIGFRLISP